MLHGKGNHFSNIRDIKIGLNFLSKNPFQKRICELKCVYMLIKHHSDMTWSLLNELVLNEVFQAQLTAMFIDEN